MASYNNRKMGQSRVSENKSVFLKMGACFWKSKCVSENGRVFWKWRFLKLAFCDYWERPNRERANYIPKDAWAGIDSPILYPPCRNGENGKPPQENPSRLSSSQRLVGVLSSRCYIALRETAIFAIFRRKCVTADAWPAMDFPIL